MEKIKDLTHLIIEFYEKLSSWEHSVVRGKDLTLPQMHTIEILGMHKAMRMKELAEKMGVTTGTLTVIVDNLESKKLIVRKPNREDRRSILVELTEKGAIYFAEHDKHHHQLTQDMIANLTEEEIEQFYHALSKINQEF